MKKIIILGNGLMANIYATILSQRNDSKLLAVVGNTEDHVLSFSNKFSVTGFSNSNLAGCLKLFPDVDAFILATPEWIRKEYLQHLIPMNKPILIEKPLVANKSDLSWIKSIVSNDITNNISVIHSLRFNPRFSQAQKAIKNRNIGEIRHIYARRNTNNEAVKRVIGKFPLVYWLCCHDIDILRWFIESDIESVYARTKNFLKSPDDYLIVHLHFKNGVDAIEEVSWCSPPLSMETPVSWFSVKGTKGLLEIDDSSQNIGIYTENKELSSIDTSDFYSIQGIYYGTFFNVLDYWIKSIKKEVPHLDNLTDAISAIEICSLIEESFLNDKIVYTNN